MTAVLVIGVAVGLVLLGLALLVVVIAAALFLRGSGQGAAEHTVEAAQLGAAQSSAAQLGAARSGAGAIDPSSSANRAASLRSASSSAASPGAGLASPHGAPPVPLSLSGGLGAVAPVDPSDGGDFGGGFGGPIFGGDEGGGDSAKTEVFQRGAHVWDDDDDDDGGGATEVFRADRIDEELANYLADDTASHKRK